MPLQHNQIYKIRNVGRDTFLSHIPPNGDGDTIVGQAGQGEPNQEWRAIELIGLQDRWIFINQRRWGDALRGPSNQVLFLIQQVGGDTYKILNGNPIDDRIDPGSLAANLESNANNFPVEFAQTLPAGVADANDQIWQFQPV